MNVFSCHRGSVQGRSDAFRFLTTRRDGAVEYLTLNRPEVRNAFNEDVIAELTAWAAQTHARPRRCASS